MNLASRKLDQLLVAVGTLDPQPKKNEQNKTDTKPKFEKILKYQIEN